MSRHVVASRGARGLPPPPIFLVADISLLFTYIKFIYSDVGPLLFWGAYRNGRENKEKRVKLKVKGGKKGILHTFSLSPLAPPPPTFKNDATCLNY